MNYSSGAKLQVPLTLFFFINYVENSEGMDSLIYALIQGINLEILVMYEF